MTARIRSRSAAHWNEHLAELSEYVTDRDITDEELDRQTKQAEEDLIDIYGRD